MDIKHLSPDVESYINAQVSEGVYSRAEEVLEDAVRRLRQADEERHGRLLKALAEEAQGEGTRYSRGLMREIGEAGMLTHFTQKCRSTSILRRWARARP